MTPGVSEDFKINLQNMKDVEEIIEIIKSSAFGTEPLNLYHLKVSVLGKELEILQEAQKQIILFLNSLVERDIKYASISDDQIKRAIIVFEGSLLMVSDFIDLVITYGDPILIPLR